MGIPNCLTSTQMHNIASTSCKNCLQYDAGVSVTELINENALSLAADFSDVLLKLFLTIPAVSVTGLILCIAKFIDERNWYCSHTDLSKKYLHLMQSID